MFPLRTAYPCHPLPHVIGPTVSEYYEVIRLPTDRQAALHFAQTALPKTDRHAALCLGIRRVSQVPDASLHAYHTLDDPGGPSRILPLAIPLYRLPAL
jgi:hypothetical protein